MALCRFRFFFSGRVQGVGFRYTCKGLARGFAVTGWVRNLEDGRVELVVEGEEKEIDRFLSAIKQEMDAFIHEIVNESELDSLENLSEFSIRH